jgi:hypothetical protein
LTKLWQESTRVRCKIKKKLNHYFPTYENLSFATLFKCNGFSTNNMPRPLLNHALFIEAICLILAALLCTLCSMTVTNYSSNSAQPITAIIPSRFSTQTMPPSLFGRQRPPPAPNILQQKRGPFIAYWHKEVPPLNQQFGSVLLIMAITKYSLNSALPNTAIIPSTFSKRTMPPS